MPQNTFTDADQQGPLSVTATLANGDPLPDWLLFDEQTLTFSGRSSVATELAIVLRAEDHQGLFATTSFDIIVEPELAPALQTMEVFTEPSIETPPQTVGSEKPTATPVVEETAEANLDFVSISDPLTPQINADEGLPQSKTVTTTSVTETPIFRDFDFLSRSVVQHRDHTVHTIKDTANLITVQKTTTLADLFTTEERKSLSNPSLLKTLDEEREQLESGLKLNTNVITGALSISTGLSIGYVIWLVRGGLLLGSVLSSLPAWRNIDPLPVLASLEGNGDSDDDDSLEEIVNQKNDDFRSKPEPEPTRGQEN